MDDGGRQVLASAHAVLIVIDEQRRHMDPEIAYHPVAAPDGPRVLANTARALGAARASGVPVVHVCTYGRLPYRGDHVDQKNPFMNRQGVIPGSGVRRQPHRCVEGSPFAEIMPEVAPRDGEPVVVKHRYSGFFNTDLDLVLRGIGATAVVLAGVNTNNCVMGTAFDAHARDYSVFVLSDACGSMNGPEFHDLGLRQIATALGWLLDVDEWVEMTAGALARRS
ncbi:MAG TPA: isochorismatase family cysteine hydrolase [Bacillota bacterium]|nr:isochorismatase family cysteine hydrolase [Bacillota bacterium]